jgi:hypothetical protein
LKRCAPPRNSDRKTSNFHRPEITSIADSTGQVAAASEKVGFRCSFAMLLLWGMKNAGLSGDVLARWEGAFPRHTTERYADVGHNVPEELGDRAIVPIERFLTANPANEVRS